jgi:hypothetical protein
MIVPFIVDVVENVQFVVIGVMPRTIIYFVAGSMVGIVVVRRIIGAGIEASACWWSVVGLVPRHG